MINNMQEKLLEMIQTIMKASNCSILCEAQLQLALAWELKKLYEDNAEIYLEYAVKHREKNRRLYYDIVIEANGEYIPIELKFKTKAVDGYEYSNHAAQNLGRYDFWADVARIQDFGKNSGKTFQKGYAILVTNDSVYWEKSGEGFLYENFSTQKGRPLHVGTILEWPKNCNFDAIGEHRKQGIAIKNEYVLNWNDVMSLTQKVEFRALILEVKILTM